MASASAFGFAAHSYEPSMVLALAIKQASSTDEIGEVLENLQSPYDGMMKNYDKPLKTEHEALRSKDYKWADLQDAKLLPTATRSSSCSRTPTTRNNRRTGPRRHA